MRRWVTKKYQINCGKIAARYGISEIMAEVLVKRGLFDWRDMDDYLFPDMDRLADACLMKDLEKAAGILAENIRQGKKIFIVGDYDVDGVMSTYILYRGLEMLGARAGYRLPHRVRDGYGMRPYMAEEAKEGGYDTIITCDNGISAGDAVARGKELGLTVIVTDHHEVPEDEDGEILPPADCVVNPKQKGCPYPWKELCGGGIAYRLMAYMLERAGRSGEARELLPFAAIATVCDVVPLLGENRILVKNGLDLLEDCPNLGLGALIRLQEFGRPVGAGDLGFRIGPCINAAGRLENGELALELLLAGDEESARKRGEELLALNERRKDYTADATRRAAEMVESGGDDRVLVLFLEDCHESVAGIVAGRIREKYYRPVLIVTKGAQGLKGSARSIPGYHMQREIERCQSLLTEFGGHAMAAGFSLEEENFEAFRQMINEHCTLGDRDMVETVNFDREVPLGQMTEGVVRELERLEPVGEGNPGGVFACRGIEIARVQFCGRDGQIARLGLRDGIRSYAGVDFHWENRLKPAITVRYGEGAWEALVQGKTPGYQVDVLYRPKINQRFGGVDFEIVDCR